MLFILLGVFLSVFCLTLAVSERYLAPVLDKKRRLKDIKRLTSVQIQGGFQEELQMNINERIFKPLLAKISALTQKYTPVKQTGFIEQKLNYAGHPFGWEAADFIAAQYAMAIGLGILAGLASVFIFYTSLPNGFMALLLGFVFGYFIVDIILKNQISNRQAAISQELPDVLDLLTISMEAGLGFDASIQRVAMKSKGPLAGEFNQSLQELRMGKTRREALKDLGERNGVDDLSKFTEAIIQADKLGVSLGNVLRGQADQMRVLRRQRAEEKAMKAPVKMLIPLVVFIFPTIFVVILAPAVIQLMGAF
ncbi:MAG TPA: type II secretion system F family protein [Syntrophomonadaceae bacterium]|nr:type II secretion system F family protein [Syntrophomonadaceae bacterium]HPR92801.1 type II secretion system F family protein [Syntrophomonadaceae bacterium]